MFGNLKDMYQLQSKAREVQKKLATETVEVKKGGVRIVMNGKQEVLQVEIENEVDKDNLEKNIKEAVNDALKNVQQLMARQMMG